MRLREQVFLGADLSFGLILTLVEYFRRYTYVILANKTKIFIFFKRFLKTLYFIRFFYLISMLSMFERIFSMLFINK